MCTDGPVIKLVPKWDSSNKKLRKMTKELAEFNLDPYSLFLFAMNSPLTKQKAVPRLNKFLNFINLSGTVQEKCSTLSKNQRKNRHGRWDQLLNLTIKLFCEMNEILLPWKRITRGIPKARRYADDRAPLLKRLERL